MRALLTALVVSVTGGAMAGEQCRAVDGDTLRCGRERVRVVGVYAAELLEPGGHAARERLQGRLGAGDVRLDRRARDKYGRTVAVVYVDGQRVRQADVGPRAGRGIRARK